MTTACGSRDLKAGRQVDPLGVTSAPQMDNSDADGAFAARVITPGDGSQWFDDPTKDLWVPDVLLLAKVHLREPNKGSPIPTSYLGPTYCSW
jgi:hypothetical protein